MALEGMFAKKYGPKGIEALHFKVRKAMGDLLVNETTKSNGFVSWLMREPYSKTKTARGIVGHEDFPGVLPMGVSEEVEVSLSAVLTEKKKMDDAIYILTVVAAGMIETIQIAGSPAYSWMKLEYNNKDLDPKANSEFSLELGDQTLELLKLFQWFGN